MAPTWTVTTSGPRGIHQAHGPIAIDRVPGDPIHLEAGPHDRTVGHGDDNASTVLRQAARDLDRSTIRRRRPRIGDQLAHRLVEQVGIEADGDAGESPG